jgi:type II secretory pathway pseudopilin PulG
MSLPFKKLSRSFTLIELLMAVSIMVIIAGVTIPSFTGYMKGQTLRNAQEQFKSDLRSVQNLALTGSKYETSVTFGGGAGPVTGPARYWLMKWTHSGTSYSSYLIYDFLVLVPVYTFEGICAANLSSLQQASYNFPSSEITFDSSQWGTASSTCLNECLFFNMLDGSTRFTSVTNVGGVCSTNDSNQVRIILKNVSGDTAPVVWNRNGMIGN